MWAQVLQVSAVRRVAILICQNSRVKNKQSIVLLVTSISGALLARCRTIELLIFYRDNYLNKNRKKYGPIWVKDNAEINATQIKKTTREGKLNLKLLQKKKSQEALSFKTRFC